MASLSNAVQEALARPPRTEILSLHSNRGQTRGSRMSEVKKCPKCGSENLREKRLKLHGSLGQMNILNVTASICNQCGYVELYEKK